MALCLEDALPLLVLFWPKPDLPLAALGLVAACASWKVQWHARRGGVVFATLLGPLLFAAYTPELSAGNPGLWLLSSGQALLSLLPGAAAAVLVATLVAALWIPGLPWYPWCWLFLAVQQYCHCFACRSYRHCFSLLEAMFWAQSCGFVAALAAEGFWQGFQSWPPVAAFCTMLAFFGLLFMFLTNVLSQFSCMDMAPLLAAAVTAGLFLLWSMTYFEAFADAPLLWFLKYILQVQNLRLLLLQWPTLLVVGVICVELLSQKLLHTDPSPKERHFVRKSFHGLAIVLFAPPLMSGQDEFLALSLLVATLLFIALEVGRCCGAPLSDVQNRYLAKFLDKREDITRDLVLTHLYLLLGCSLPVWLETWRPPSASSNLRKYAGLLLIGVGDSCAALFGILYGRLRWPSSHRTFVGSTAFAVSVTLAAAPLMAGWPYFALATAATTLLEVYTQSIDNLVLPLFFCAAYTAMLP